MTNLDWVPENPYDPKVNLDEYYGFNHGWIAGQKKLLEHLILYCDAERDKVLKHKYKSMLKQVLGEK